MASINIPIKVNLPDNWAEIVAEKLKQDDDYVLVTRCKDCKAFEPDPFHEGWMRCGLDEYRRHNEDFCSQAERKEQKEQK